MFGFGYRNEASSTIIRDPGDVTSLEYVLDRYPGRDLGQPYQIGKSMAIAPSTNYLKIPYPRDYDDLLLFYETF
ncbi:hypothetical protein FRC18_004583 [Serendipita sp. 400]|nr:hypothetical protein FRC18_004583 [Serendipita sp. 400]